MLLVWFQWKRKDPPRGWDRLSLKSFLRLSESTLRYRFLIHAQSGIINSSMTYVQCIRGCCLQSGHATVQSGLVRIGHGRWQEVQGQCRWPWQAERFGSRRVWSGWAIYTPPYRHCYGCKGIGVFSCNTDKGSNSEINITDWVGNLSLGLEKY